MADVKSLVKALKDMAVTQYGKGAPYRDALASALKGDMAGVNQSLSKSELTPMDFAGLVGGIKGVGLGQRLVDIPLSHIEHGESILPGGKLTFPTAKNLIQEYAKKETPFPPIEVVSNEAGSSVPWMIADGSHRYEAAKLRGMNSIPAYISEHDIDGLNLAKNYK
jgi:hypothetical protein